MFVMIAPLGRAVRQRPAISPAWFVPISTTSTSVV